VTSSVRAVADDQTAFPTLDEGEIAALVALGTRRRVAKGEVLYREGDVAYDFFVVLSGEVEIVAGTGDDEHSITRHGAGRFLGELNLLTGLRVFVTARVAKDGEVLVIPATELRHAAGVERRDPGRVHRSPVRTADRCRYRHPRDRLPVLAGDARHPGIPDPQPHPAHVGRSRS
jgi:CRP-like cAMP-binding protein